MIIESLWVLLLGMVGVFFVMGIIVLALAILNRASKRKSKDSIK